MMAFRLLRYAPIPVLLFSFSRTGLAEDYFDPAALELSSSEQKTADLHYFSRKGGQMPGTWTVTLEINGREERRQEMTFVAEKDGLLPVFSVTLLEALGVNISAIPAFSRLKEGETFTHLGDFIPAARATYDFNQQRLYISLPQAAMKNRSRGYVPPSQWDDGIAAAFVDYSLTGASAHRQSGNSASSYLSLRNGVNLGPWRLRNTSAWSHSDDAGDSFQSQSTWLMRDIRSLNSQLRVGDAWTAGDVFDSVAFRGVQLASSDSMLPDSQRGFAPTIRGVAHSFAKVSISQNGYVIYETWVAAGPFVINDLFPGAQSGDLQVTVTESDGSKRVFTQPFSAVPFMRRQGSLKYSLNAGRFHSGSGDTHAPDFVEGALFYGLTSQMTVYGGIRGADNYQAAALGIGQGFGVFGSLGVDDTVARSRLPDGKDVTGQAWRIQYQKDFSATGTAFNLASYRYATGNYYEFSELNQSDSQQLRLNNRRSRSQITFSQTLGSLGSLSVSAWMQDYWHTSGQDKTIHVGWYSSWRGISWGLGYYYTDSALERNPERTLSFNITVPLNKWLPDSSVSYFTNHNNRGMSTQQMSLNGTALANRNLNYSVQQSVASGGQNDSTSLAMQYNGGYGNVSLGYDHSRSGNNMTLGLAGGVIATQYGVTLSQPLGDTVALLRVPEAANVQPEGYNGIHTDSRGYAVMPSLLAYRRNSINLDTATLGENADVEQSGLTLIPTSGAVVLANYKTHIGYRVLFSLRFRGEPLPFGAQVEVIEHNRSAANRSMVADSGQAYVSGVPERGTLRASWYEDGKPRQCQSSFKLGTSHIAPGIATLALECH
ncbi:fimbria/pilus outer membrane usher protein [Enterobacter sp. JS8-1]|uniref:fimbria/pilus outer membrane usher protein n=1 Tax=Enterobacter sp. JS8-1 TaxID=3411633 RepID=UPI003B9EF4C4